LETEVFHPKPIRKKLPDNPGLSFLTSRLFWLKKPVEAIPDLLSFSEKHQANQEFDSQGVI